ncbi:MAG: discoidin domain-containing protein [Saprospiraceae bacterium]
MINQTHTNACLIAFFCLLGLGLFAQTAGTTFSRGIGKYPGAETENFSPLMTGVNPEWHNLALHRPAYHSSSYDYNLTAQLVTDGLIDQIEPTTYSGATSQVGQLPKNQRLYLVDHNPVTRLPVDGPEGWVEVSWQGPETFPEIDSLIFGFDVQGDAKSTGEWVIEMVGSPDGSHWHTLGKVTGKGIPGDTITPAFRYFLPGNHRVVPLRLTPAADLQYLRVRFEAPAVNHWNIGGLETFRQGNKVTLLTSSLFTSAWMDTGSPTEWLKIDLGDQATINQVILDWIERPDAVALQYSEDGSEWTSWKDIPAAATGNRDLVIVDRPLHTRYLRLLLTHQSRRPAILSEFQVMGTGGPAWQPKPMPEGQDHRMLLAGGNWKVQRAAQVTVSGAELANTGFEDDDWLTATVPGTVLTSFLNMGAIPDPDYGDNQLMLSESYFNSDFWYRNEFEVPQNFIRDRVFLQFKGINWKAEVYCNGVSIGHITGAFTGPVFDVTDHIHPGTNALAVRIICNANPGGVKEQTAASPDLNGGVLGADNPTFHATIGWDWIPTIRGRDAGIWDDVLLFSTGPVTVETPFIHTTLPLPKVDEADVSVELTLVNHTNQFQQGVVKGKLGNIDFEQPFRLGPHEKSPFRFTPESFRQLHLRNPRLWWPNGYGDPNLYAVTLSCELASGINSDVVQFKTGLRQMTYSQVEEGLRIYVNGQRFVPLGGNWGFSESMLRYRAREFDIAVRYHRDMNYTMIRNWVGMTGDDAFFEACDRYGIMIWQDFWLANPWDGPDPDNEPMFMANAQDFVHRIRNHPSIAFYCGRNEGNPPPTLNEDLHALVDNEHPGMLYFPHSAEGGVSGYGPYGAMPATFYFKYRATAKPHSELGMANIVSKESLDRMMPAEGQWPIGRMWGLHDFCDAGAQNGAAYQKLMEINFGPINHLDDWLSLAQFRNYEGYRAMYEAQSRNRMGLLIWMSHSAWPSFVWQTYDYYFEPTAAYFGVKKACEPLHIQWNAATDSIEVVNYCHPDINGLRVQAEIFDLTGKKLWNKEAIVDSKRDSRVIPFIANQPEGLTSVYFFRLKLWEGEQVVSENFYWRGPVTDQPLGDNFMLRNAFDNDYSALRTLPKVPVERTEISRQKTGNEEVMDIRIKNTGNRPALMIRLNVVGEQSGEQILPVLYEDNYFSLMPGEEKVIRIKVKLEDARGETPLVKVSGFNAEEH